MYQTIGEVYCPYFKEKVHFNSLGLEHLKFKSRDKARLVKDQYMRMKLLHLAPEVLRISSTLQGILETKSFEKIRVNNRTDRVLKEVVYYEFIAIINNIRVKIVVKYISGQDKIFWILIPHWKYFKKRRTRKMHTGNLEED